MITRRIRLLVGMLCFAAPAPAQQATTGVFGQGCGNPLDPYGTILSYTGAPRLGVNFAVNYQVPTWSVGRVSAFAFLFTGPSNSSLLGIPLPIAAWYTLGGAVGAPHCMILTSSDWLTGTTFGYPQGQLQLRVPLDPSLVGVRLYQQWMIYWLLNYQGSTTEIIYFSNGGVITLGY